MGNHAGKSVSIWMAGDAALPPFAPLSRDARAEVCVVGAGIAGLTTAYLLGRAGKSVLVLDDGPVAGGETERTTAHLTAVLDKRYSALERLHGAKGAHLAAKSHVAAIDLIERLIREERIECGFERVDGYLFGRSAEPAESLEEELAAVQRAGLAGVELVAKVPWDSFDTGPALRFPRQAQFQPLKYAAALARAIVRDGGRICTQTHAAKIEGGEAARVETNAGWRVAADAVVVATHTPVNDLVAVHTKQAAYRTFVLGAAVPAGSVPKALYWDIADPYHYVRVVPSAGEDLLIVGGEDHKTGQADDAEARYARLERWARERFPMMAEPEFRWSGQVMEPVDGLAFIGRNPMDRKNVFIATGFSGNGMTYGTLAGMLIADLVEGREHAWEPLYDPARKTLGAAGTFARENANTAAQYADWLTPGDIEAEVRIAPGSGAVVRRGLKKVAVYRDDAGELHPCSAVCPHLGGIVAWNHAEETWDCPCHGSRFDKFGKVLDGPAISNLVPVEKSPAA